MTKRVDLKSQKGLTIIEVLISAVVFVIGFSLLIALLSNTESRFSIKELTDADRIGHEIMVTTTTLAVTTPLDRVIVQSGQKFRVRRQSVVEDGLAGVTVTVSRVGSGKVILELYDAFQVSE